MSDSTRGADSNCGDPEDSSNLVAWPAYELLSREIIYDCPWVGLRRDMVRLDNDEPQELHVVEITDSIAVVPVMTDGRIAMLWQFRHPHGKTHWEIPAGRIDPGEEAVEAAVRELHEESGAKPARMERVAGFYPTNGISAHFATLFVAHDCVMEGQPHPEAAERIRIVLRDPAEVHAELLAGKYEDGFTALALFHYFARAKSQ